MTSFKNAVVVIGLDSMPGLQTARIFARRGVTVFGIASNAKHYACGTNCCEKIYFNETSGDSLVKLLERIGPEFDHKPLLVPCVDGSVWTISKRRDELKQHYEMALPDHDVIQLLIDKVRFYKFAGENDLAIPKTYFLENRTDALEASRQISYPCALKPPYRGRDWNVHINEKALPAANASEFLALYDRCAPYSDALIAQRWISGPDQNLYSCNCYFSRDSVPLATFVAKKLRQWPPETGYSCLGEEVRADPVLEETVRLFSSVGYQGLGYVEMKLDDEDGKFYIIEPNVGRPTGRSAIAEAGGVEILHTMYCDIYGLPLPEQREQKYEGVKWIHLLRDLQSAWHYYRRGQLTFRQWRQSIKGRKAYAVFDWRDPAPFLREISQGFRQVLSVRWVRAPAVRSKAEKAT